MKRVSKAPKGVQEGGAGVDSLYHGSLYHQNMNCVEEDKFLATHIAHIILKGYGKLHKEARRKEFRRKEEQEFTPDTVDESLNHQKTNCIE